MQFLFCKEYYLHFDRFEGPFDNHHNFISFYNEMSLKSNDNFFEIISKKFSKYFYYSLPPDSGLADLSEIL